MIRVIGEAACLSVDVESDPWVPLKISWWPRSQVQPLYLRVSGTAGGEVELKADPLTGALLQMIVLGEPMARMQDLRSSPRSSNVRVNGVPVLDRSMWGVDDESQLVEARPLFVESRSLAIHRSEGLTVLYFSEYPVETRLQCEGVAVGIAANQALVSVEVRLDS